MWTGILNWYVSPLTHLCWPQIPVLLFAFTQWSHTRTHTHWLLWKGFSVVALDSLGDNLFEHGDALVRVWLWHHQLWADRYGNATLSDRLVFLRPTDSRHRHHVSELVWQRPQEHEPACLRGAEAFPRRLREQGDGGARCAVGRRGQRESRRFVGDRGRPCLQMSGKWLVYGASCGRVFFEKALIDYFIYLWRDFF